ncbi:hypothetical protein JCM3766R1_006949, partial [Sporobolomyces carnicolor]
MTSKQHMSQPVQALRSNSSSSTSNFDDGEKRSVSPISDESQGRVKSATTTERDLRFWLVFLSLCVSMFLSALDLTAISTALPD